jgi:hemin uptake protein HemP
MRSTVSSERPVPRPEGSPPERPRRLRSSELMSGQREILIEHAGSEYRLRVTNQNKLILTK